MHTPRPQANQLAAESSLYLRQHAHNPVHWYAWSNEAWEKAKRENKLVLVSIGYSSCHWCHVMERESFEDSATAKLMNDNFVCIKVDREERPDIDAIYMKAVQLMTGSGGWPLNCFTLPDGKPIYGGTYFPNAKWKELIVQLHNFYSENPGQAKQYAEELTQGVRHPEIFPVNVHQSDLSSAELAKSVGEWKKYLDNVEGGPNRSPKFPLPNNYEFLMRYASANKDHDLMKHVNLTLEKMAYGGIYDQIGGGFARYSTDSLWKVPHFEKMLYDNAQLISLYSQAYQLTGKELYKEVVYETAEFLKREMSNSAGSYFSALDADSEGEEGKYYIWSKEELTNVELPNLPDSMEREVLFDYYNVTRLGFWEDDKYILLRKHSDAEMANKYNLSEKEFHSFINTAKANLLAERSKRIHPGLDTKQVTSWNALMVSALCKAYNAFGDEEFLKEAQKTMANLLSTALTTDKKILHTESQHQKMKCGYLDDYAFTISALINLYQVTFDEEYLRKARMFADEAIAMYYDSDDGLFWYTSSLNHELIGRTKELSDNVIPASNSEMANALFMLGQYYDNSYYSDMSANMLKQVQNDMTRWGSAYSNWMMLQMNLTGEFHQTVIAGIDAEKKRKELSRKYIPNTLFAGSAHASQLPLLESRVVNNKTYIYICSNNTCKLPIESASEAFTQLKN
jgi:uncharacterized protein YyaL (SSP411 family)